MTSERKSFFRQAVLDEQNAAGLGEVVLIVPPNARYLALGVGVTALVACLFLCFAKFTRTERVSGILRVAKKPIQLLVPFQGTLSSILVESGSAIEQGQLLATINRETILQGGEAQAILQSSELEKSRQAILERRARLWNKRTLATEKSNAAIKAFDAESESVEMLIAELEARVKNAVPGDQSADIVSMRDRIVVERRELRLIKTRRQLSVDEKTEALQKIDDQKNEIDSRLAEIQNEKFKLEGSSQIEIRAPIRGHISHVKFNPGDSLLQGDRLLLIVPEGSDLNAELYVPARSIPYVFVGSRLQLSLDDFSTSEYGLFPSAIESISETLLPEDEMKRLDANSFSYVVRVKFDQRAVERIQDRLKDGIGVTASIPLARRRLWDWIVEPMNQVNKLGMK